MPFPYLPPPGRAGRARRPSQCQTISAVRTTSGTNLPHRPSGSRASRPHRLGLIAVAAPEAPPSDRHWGQTASRDRPWRSRQIPVTGVRLLPRGWTESRPEAPSGDHHLHWRPECIVETDMCFLFNHQNQKPTPALIS